MIKQKNFKHDIIMKNIYNILKISGLLILTYSAFAQKEDINEKPEGSKNTEIESVDRRVNVQIHRQLAQADRELARAQVYVNRSHSGNSFDTENNTVEKKKTINKTFSVDAKDRLVINNQHGEVKIELWNKNEIKVDITVSGFGSTEDKAQAYIDAVEIIDKREGDKISFKTMIDNDGTNNSWWGGNWSWNGWNKDKDESCNCPDDKNKRGVEVNYQVFMPRNNALSVSDKYGAIKIAEFSAPLIVFSNYGSFTSEKLTGSDKDVKVRYGKATMKNVDDADLDISYSKVSVEKANNLRINNNYGSMDLGEVNNVDGTIQYSSGKIGTIRDSGKLFVSYSDGLELHELSKTLKSLDITSNFTAVRLPVNQDVNANFDISLTHANFKYPAGRVSFTYNSDDEDERTFSWLSNKNYKGKIGKGSGTKIVIKSNYGGVKFVEK